jgi:hypothetical protein
MKNKTFIALLSIAVIGIIYLGSKLAPDINRVGLVESRKPKVKLRKIELPHLSETMPNIAELNELISKIVGLSNETISVRNNIVSKLREQNLSKADFEAIYVFLKTNPLQSGSQLSLHSLKNDLLVFTIDDGRYKENTAQLMIDIINDQGHHEVMREYTLQYIPDYFHKHWLQVRGASKKEKEELSNLDIELQDAFISTMFKMLDEKKGPIPGTSLIKLHELSEHFTKIDKVDVENATKLMINDPFMPVSSRMAALSVAAEKQLLEVAPIAEELTFDETISVSLRMAAMHTASTMNTTISFIEKLEENFIENESADKRQP